MIVFMYVERKAPSEVDYREKYIINFLRNWNVSIIIIIINIRQ